MKVDAQRYGPWAIVAGGSEGIGACIAVDLANSGINVLLIGRKIEPLEAVAAQVRATGAEARVLSLDLTHPEMLDQIGEATAGLDIGLLVYNAGAAHRTGFFLDWPLDDVLKVINLNAVGQAKLAHYFGRKLAERGRGGIVLIGSMGGNAGSPGVATYAGAKAFSQIFAESIWWELKQQGVDVLYMVVGPTDTPAMERLGITYHEGEAVQPQEVADHTLENIGNGPVFVMPELRDAFRQFATPDRRAATEMNAAYVMGNTEDSFAEPGK